MLKKSTKEIIAYVAFAVSLIIVIIAIYFRADLMALTTLLLSLLGIVWNQVQRSKAKRKKDYDTLTQKCSIHNEEILASVRRSHNGSGNVHLEKDL